MERLPKKNLPTLTTKNLSYLSMFQALSKKILQTNIIHYRKESLLKLFEKDFPSRIFRFSFAMWDKKKSSSFSPRKEFLENPRKFTKPLSFICTWKEKLYKEWRKIKFFSTYLTNRRKKSCNSSRLNLNPWYLSWQLILQIILFKNSTSKTLPWNLTSLKKFNKEGSLSRFGDCNIRTNPTSIFRDFF